MTQTTVYDILILGAGWTSTFLIPLLSARHASYAATTTTGRDSTIKFRFDSSATAEEALAAIRPLPEAHAILISFPLLGRHASHTLVTAYHASHTARPHFVQLGSSGIWARAAAAASNAASNPSPALPPPPPPPPTSSATTNDIWLTRHSAYNHSDARAIAEDELRALGGVVLNLAGLWGGARQPRRWVARVATTKAQVCAKTSLHLVHGRDVARAIDAVVREWVSGERWMVTDMFVYDWWALIAGWGDGEETGEEEEEEVEAEEKEKEKESEEEKQEKMDQDQRTKKTNGGKDARGKQLQWVRECMDEAGVRALPRSMEALGRCYDSREFWRRFGITPVRARVG